MVYLCIVLLLKPIYLLIYPKKAVFKSLKFSAMMVCDIIGSADFFVEIVCGDFLGFVIPCSYERV